SPRRRREARGPRGRGGGGIDARPRTGCPRDCRPERQPHHLPHRPRAPMSTRLDATPLGVLSTRIISIVDEAAKAIVRTSFSTLSNEANDFACVLTDARGRALAQNSGSIPSFIGTP